MKSSTLAGFGRNWTLVIPRKMIVLVDHSSAQIDRMKTILLGKKELMVDNFLGLVEHKIALVGVEVGYKQEQLVEVVGHKQEQLVEVVGHKQEQLVEVVGHKQEQLVVDSFAEVVEEVVGHTIASVEVGQVVNTA